MFQGEYSEAFLEKFRTAIGEVGAQLKTGWTGARHVADELALHLIVTEAVHAGKLFDVDIPEGLFDLTGDLDYQFLYDDVLPSTEVACMLGMGDYSFENWFTPFWDDEELEAAG